MSPDSAIFANSAVTGEASFEIRGAANAALAPSCVCAHVLPGGLG